MGGRRVFAVRDHKTATVQPAMFCLSLEEEYLFQKYHERVSETYSQMCQGNKRSREYFFVRYPDGQEEAPYIKSPSEEITRLQEELKVPRFTATAARHAMQTASDAQ